MTLEDPGLRPDDLATPAGPLEGTVPGPDGAAPRRHWWRSPRLMTVVAAVLVAAGIGLRFVSVGPLWLDEAQSVFIAHQPLSALPHQLRSDGAPPFWYLLLHLWMRAFGDGTYTVRLMAIIPGVLSIPLAGWLGQRIGGRAVGRTSAVLLAVLPFAIRYSVETRMYSLLLLLSLLAAHSLLWLHRTRRPWPAALALFACTTLLLYTHYYALWLGIVVGGGELFAAWRKGQRRSWWSVAAIAAAGIAFLPWVPTLLFQSAHTGAPWDGPPGLGSIFGIVTSWSGGASVVSSLLTLVIYGVMILAVLGRRGTSRTVVIGPPASPTSLRLLGVCSGVVILAVIDSIIGKQAFAPRYTSVVVGLFVVLMAVGLHVIPSRRLRLSVIALFAVSGIVIGTLVVSKPRTEVASVATELEQVAQPGDIVFYCPDQLGPSAVRIIPPSLGLTQATYPDFGSPDRVNWVDWTLRQETSNPEAVAEQLISMMGKHTLFLDWSPAFRYAGPQCSALMSELTTLVGDPYIAVPRRSQISESMSLYSFVRPEAPLRLAHGRPVDGRLAGPEIPR